MIIDANNETKKIFIHSVYNDDGKGYSVSTIYKIIERLTKAAEFAETPSGTRKSF